MEANQKKLLFIGNGACGKTSLISTYVKGEFPEEVFSLFNSDTNENVVKVTVDDKTVEFVLWDTKEPEEYTRLRRLNYPCTDVVILCFSIASPIDLECVSVKWEPEIKELLPDIPIILVGMKIDLRYDNKTIEQLKRQNEETVKYDEGKAMAEQIRAYRYLESSAKAKLGVNDVFKTAAWASMMHKDIKKKKRCLLF